VFSERLPPHLVTNRLTRALEERRARGEPILDLTLSNPTRAGFDYPSDLLAPLAHPRGLTYTPQPFGLIDARRAVARDYARQGLTVPPDRVVLTASTSEAYSLLFKLLTDPGDEILVPRPSYPLFDHLARLDAVSPRPYDLEYHGRWSIDFASVERACTDRTRAVIVVSPNNPTGSFIRRDELARLVTMCAARNLPIVADEVFADYELEPGSAHASGRVLAQHDVLAFALGGLSKTVGLPQVKLGWMAVSGPESVAAPALERLELICDTYLSASTPVQAAASDLLERGAAVRDQIAGRVGTNYRWLKSYTEATACTCRYAEGGWSAVLQVPSLESEDELVIGLLIKDGILSHPGYFFDFPRESFLVVSLLTPEAILRDGVGRILRHFICSTSESQTNDVTQCRHQAGSGPREPSRNA
jgi:aspartate/methionine/tyrosine aminotransferase